jgi:hypothetical protein
VADPPNPQSPHPSEGEPTRPTQLTQPKEGEPIEIPVPKEDDFEKLVRRAVKGNDPAAASKSGEDVT